MKIRMAISPPANALTAEAFGPCLEACEALGFDTLWLSDIPLGPSGDPLVSLAFAAAATRRLKLGANIVPLGRNPLWLAKQLAQIDQLSGGRLLLSFVPGLGAPAERAALGHARGNRGQAIDDIIGLMRRWWAGEAVTATFGACTYDAVTVSPQPCQAPLEIWLGGKGAPALSRVARLADGWLTSVMTPAEARAGVAVIEREAAAAGRHIDPEHFGISVPVSRGLIDQAAQATLAERRDDGDLSEIIAVGGADLGDLLRAHIDAGLSKFVLRSIEPAAAADDWYSQLGWLADQVLPLQT